MSICPPNKNGPEGPQVDIRAYTKTTEASRSRRMPLTAPGSFPPWPGSRTILMCPPKEKPRRGGVVEVYFAGFYTRFADAFQVPGVPATVQIQ